MFAVIESGGKQHRVEPGEVLDLEKLGGDVGASVTFERVMMVGDGDHVTVGRPYVDGGRVTAEILEHGRGEKVRIVKFKRRKDYKRVLGHRQWFTRVRITDIAG